MYPHVTQFETRTMLATHDLQLRELRRRPRRRLFARLWLVARTVDPATPNTSPVRSA